MGIGPIIAAIAGAGVACGAVDASRVTITVAGVGAGGGIEAASSLSVSSMATDSATDSRSIIATSVGGTVRGGTGVCVGAISMVGATTGVGGEIAGVPPAVGVMSDSECGSLSAPPAAIAAGSLSASSVLAVNGASVDGGSAVCNGALAGASVGAMAAMPPEDSGPPELETAHTAKATATATTATPAPANAGDRRNCRNGFRVPNRREKKDCIACSSMRLSSHCQGSLGERRSDASLSKWSRRTRSISGSNSLSGELL